MTSNLKLMAVMAHPDDESLGIGGTIARYANEGIPCYLVCATRGERGRYFDNANRPSNEEVGRVREQELRAAAKELNISELVFLDCHDGDIDQAVPSEIISKIVREYRRVKPDVAISFGPSGGYGHPDHIAISQFATSAANAAADPDFRYHPGIDGLAEPHAVKKLYYMEWSLDKMRAYQEAFREFKMNIDGVERRPSPWPDWALTTQIDTAKYWPQVWKAIQCHQTQLAIYDKLAHLSEENHQRLWGTQEFYRALSTVNGGRKRESDLFEGLR